MTLNGVMADTLRYLNVFGKPAFQLITAFSSIELVNEKSASKTHRALKLVYLTKFTHSRMDTTGNRLTFLRLINRLSFTSPL